jgi:hypothetical protein
MNIEKMLEDEFRVVAGDLDVPPAPVVDLVRAGTRARNRTRVYVAGLAAAAVAVVATGLAIADGDPRADDQEPAPAPSPTRVIDENVGFPAGEAPSVPYIVDEKLFVDGKRIPGMWEPLPETQVGGTSTFVNWSTERGWLLVRNGDVEQLTVDRGAPKLSPDGRFLVHFVGAAMVLRDLVADRELGRISIHEELNADNEYSTVPRGVDNAGRVFYGSGRVFMWDGSGQSVPVTRPSGPPPIAGDIYHVLADRIVVLGKPDGTVLYRATVGDDGRINLEDALPGSGPRFVSPDGSWVAWQTTAEGETTGNLGDPEEDAVTVQAVGSAERFTVPLLEGTFIRDIRWESHDSMLITMGDRVVRCDVVERACEYAVAPVR